jgi:hypothetical protein
LAHHRALKVAKIVMAERQIFGEIAGTGGEGRLPDIRMPTVVALGRFNRDRLPQVAHRREQLCAVAYHRMLPGVSRVITPAMEGR